MTLNSRYRYQVHEITAKRCFLPLRDTYFINTIFNLQPEAKYTAYGQQLS